MKRSILFILTVSMLVAVAKAGDKLVVAKDGSGQFTSIQAAINSLDSFSKEPRVIYIKRGVYEEKLLVRKSNIVFEGEDRAGAIITQSIARDEWRCLNNDDWGVATLNIDANDITLRNLTVINSFGFDWKVDKTIDCIKDTANKTKVIGRSSHQMAVRTMNATRLKAVNCHFKAYGGDTVSPWNVEAGLFYFKECVIEGGVDFYCPRGWAWAENCEFITHSGTAAIWHDGSKYEDSKTVLVNCRFKGYEGFLLGRYHRDAQFYLLNCWFAKTMKDAPIYKVPTNNTIQWGHRVYYYDCKREGGNDFVWYKNNLPAGIAATAITPAWVFGQRWSPAE
ncbi:MAG: hypothetical protein RLZZ316_2377 [Bacteroidota bacterium]